MVGNLTSIYRGEESLPTEGICTMYCDRPERARWCQNNRSAAQLEDYFRGGAPNRAMGTFAGKHRAVYCRTMALRSSYHHFSLG